MTTSRYVVAPREPTIEMQRANGSSLVEDEVSRAWLDRDARETWAAMLAAIPDDPAAPVLVERSELEALRAAQRLIHGFMLDVNVIGISAAALNLTRGIKAHALAANGGKVA